MKIIATSLRDATHFPWAEVPAAFASRIASATGFVQQGNSNLSFQVLLVQWNTREAPTKDVCKTLFRGYRSRHAFPLVVALVNASGSTYCYGPTEDGIVEGPFNESQVARILSAAIAETNPALARSLVVHYFDSLHTSAMPGITNSGLFASYYLRTSAPQRPDFESAKSRALTLVGERGEGLIRALGYHSRWEGSTAMVLTNNQDVSRAVAVLLERSESFAESSPRFLTSPIASGLALAQAKEIPWLIALRGSQIRLYSAKATEGVGRKGQSETYLEIDLAVVDDHYAPLLPLVFSADALAPSGSTEELLRESARYAVGLGQRLRSRVYEEVVPRLSVTVAKALQDQGAILDQAGLDLAYSATLRILFRLLFQAYGEDRGLLPYAKNDAYDRHAIKTIAKELLEHPPDSDQVDESESYWQELSLAWQVIDKGDRTWGVPAYNGGLFSSVDDEGRALAQISITNTTLLPCLRSLLIDASEDGTLGPVDFRSLSVREFGTIYEGLLESSLSLAEVDLTLDTAGTWIPVQPGNHIEVQAGEPYFHNASGARKATGSYFTPSFLVDHLIEQSLVPAIDAHLARIAELIAKGDEPEAARRFFDFRICDLAMGSGHFLISAIDHAEAKMSAFLEMRPIAQVTQEMLALQHVATESLGELATDTEIEPASLLRRQIARRCIYGLDINAIAVELARVAIWIHTFVPGLAMSSLEHGLVHGNSLTGIGTIDEALAELDPPQRKGRSDIPSLFRGVIEDALAEAANLLRDAASAAEATAVDVAKAAYVTREARTKAEPTKVLFDAAVAMRLGKLRREIGTDPDALRRQAGTPEIKEIINQLQPAHMPYLFPEVFLRDNGGFDVLVGNPPWEKMHLEEDQWWGMRFPGLHNHNIRDSRAALKKAQEEHPELTFEFQRAVAAKLSEREAVSNGPYPGISAGHIDLFEAFAWRNYQLLRTGGYSGVVLPRGALAGSGTKMWREEILYHARFAQVLLLANSRHWVFEDVDTRYNIALVTIERTLSDTVSFNGPFTSYEAFEAGHESMVEVQTSNFKSWSSTYVFPWLPSETSVDVFLQLRSHPRFDASNGFSFRPVQGDLNTTNNREFWDLDLKHPSGDIKVYSGRTFEIWNPDHGDPYAYAHSGEIIPFLEGKLRNQRNNRRSAFYGLTDHQLKPRPWERARIAFRDVTNSTNTRTMIACLLPPGVCIVHTSPYLLRTIGDECHEAYLLGVLSSIPFDWYARRYVELHMTFDVLAPMPIPRPQTDDPLRKRVIEITGRLAAPDDRYATWANAVGVSIGTVNSQSDKDDLIAELDAVVALLYGLSGTQLSHIFETFHVGWACQSRLRAALDHFERWQARRS